MIAEVAQLLAWAHAVFGGRQGPVENGHAWDHELLVQHEAGGWVTETLTFSTSAAFGGDGSSTRRHTSTRWPATSFCAS
ncbi:MAG: hypothetical protein QM788_06375 [Roseateles sp.]|uniref:hypothetical protein n=1 Tax=Roseateles sp. TaxID=1971397 RepID=UPI0039E7398D